MYPSKPYTLDEEIESWKGFPWALRKEDVEVWERMTRGAREHEYAIKKSGRWLTTEPFFIAILFLQYKTIQSLEREAERLKKLRRDGKTIALINAPLTIGSRDAKAGERLVFNKYGEQYFLSQIWLSVDNGQQLFPSSLETRIARERKLGHNKSLPQRVEIAVRTK